MIEEIEIDEFMTDDEQKRCPECIGYLGRMLDICVGKGHDGRPDPTPEHVRHYRAQWGLPPLGSNEKKLPYNGPMRGMGDLVATAIKKATFGKVTPCGGCQKRQDWLNKVIPFHQAQQELKMEQPVVTWSYGVTTVKPREQSRLLDKTLESLAHAGFDKPRLFIDGDNSNFERFGLEMSHRAQQTRTYGNWLLALVELVIRNPYADRYAIFQDDFVTVKNLRQYLDKVEYPRQGYLNLYTFPHNQPHELAKRVVPDGKGGNRRTHPDLDPNKVGFYPACQNGKGAVALVFSNDAVLTLLSQRHMYQRMQNDVRGHKAVDGAVVEAFRQIGWTEYVHNPSLVQHTGLISSMGNPQHAQANSFPGEDFDALDLLQISK